MWRDTTGQFLDIRCGDAWALADTLDDNSIHLLVTSPPYWNLRDYGTARWNGGNPECDHEVQKWDGPKQTQGAQSSHAAKSDRLARSVCGKCGAIREDDQFGLEASPEAYVAKLVDLFRRLRPKLRDDATAWIVIGDSYAGSGVHSEGHANPGISKAGHRGGDVPTPIPAGLKPKDLVGIPHRVAFALRDDGWYLRSMIVWGKGVSFCDTYSGSVMPESVGGVRWEKHRIKVKDGDRPVRKSNPDRDDAGRCNVGGNPWNEYIDCPGCPKCAPNDGLVLRRSAWRPTTGHEFIIMLSKTDRYFCDPEEAKEKNSPNSGTWGARPDGKMSDDGAQGRHGKTSIHQAMSKEEKLKWYGNGRNLRNIWLINPGQFNGPHYAVYPEKLVEPIIRIGTSGKGVCPDCGASWARVIEKTPMPRNENRTHSTEEQRLGRSPCPEPTNGVTGPTTKTIGWRPTCECQNPNTVPAVVCDPFLGSGTTMKVARELKRSCIGFELNPATVKLAEDRCNIKQVSVFNDWK